MNSCMCLHIHMYDTHVYILNLHMNVYKNNDNDVRCIERELLTTNLKK